MASDVQIMCRALSKLGTSRITARDDDTKQAEEMDACYESVRDAEFRRNRWRFTLKRASLSALTDEPVFRYATQFLMPTDCLQVIQVGEHDVPNLSNMRTAFEEGPFSIEGRNILTDFAAPLSIRYVARIEDPAQFDATFVESFASRLAYETCEAITGSSTKKQDLWSDYKNALDEASRANAIETIPQAITDDSWVACR